MNRLRWAVFVATATVATTVACSPAVTPPPDAAPCATLPDADAAGTDDAADAAAEALAGEVSPVADAIADLPVAATADAPVDATVADDAQQFETTEDFAAPCFDALPAADAAVADLPAPDAATCSLPPGPIGAWTGPDGAAMGPPTLAVEVGVSDAKTGAFVPYIDGQWLPIVHGNQGGIHVWAAVRVALPDLTEVKAVVEVHGQLRMDCAVCSEPFPTSPKLKVHADELAPGTFTSASGGAPGLTVIFQPGPTGKQADSGHYCGRWLLLVFEARLPGQAAWGRAVRAVRLYDS